MNSLYGWVMSQKLPLGDFKWVEETSEITKDFLKIYNEDSNIVYFVEADIQYFEKLHELRTQFWKNYGKREKTQIYQACNNGSKRELFSVRSKLSYNKGFSENLLAIEMERIRTHMSTLVYLAPTILKISKIIIYEFWYDFVKPKYREKTKLCYLDTNSFIVYIKTENIYVGITQYVETRFDTSNYELERPLSKEKKSNWINET